MAFLWSEFDRDVDGELLKMAGALWLSVCTPLEDLQVSQLRIHQWIGKFILSKLVHLE